MWCRFIPAALVIGALLVSSTAQASPIDYSKVSDETLAVSMIVTGVILTIIAALGIWGLIRYRKQLAETGRGWPVWAVVLAVFAAVIFWTVLFFSRV